MLPPQATPFLLTLAISTLIGIGLRDYYEREGKFDTFGTVRTLVFIGMLGFMLYTLPEIGGYAFLLGLVTVVAFLLVYYSDKVQAKKSPGMIGITIAQLSARARKLKRQHGLDLVAAGPRRPVEDLAQLLAPREGHVQLEEEPVELRLG